MRISYSDINESIAKKLNSLFPIPDSVIEVNPGKAYLPHKYVEIGESILDLPIKIDDTWVISYPRTGSTWAQEMIWLLGNNFDFERSKKIQQLVRAPILEVTAILSDEHSDWIKNYIGNSVERVRNLPSPRFLRSHLQWELLPSEIKTVKPKIIYTARNPKDLCVSLYHYLQLVHGLRGPFESFCDLFLEDNIPVGAYWSHVLEFWNRRNEPNILFLKYEDMKRNLPAVIQECADFLGIDQQLTNKNMDKMCDHLKFDQMQFNSAVNGDLVLYPSDSETQNSVNNDLKFIRKGQIGDWKNYISPDLSRRIDEWTNKNTAGTGLEFEYE